MFFHLSFAPNSGPPGKDINGYFHKVLREGQPDICMNALGLSILILQAWHHHQLDNLVNPDDGKMNERENSKAKSSKSLSEPFL